MTEEVLRQLMVVAVTTIAVSFFFKLRYRYLWERLTDYYYNEHIYPLLKTSKARAHQRELTWSAFASQFGFSKRKR